LPGNEAAGRLMNSRNALSAAAAVVEAWMTDDEDSSSAYDTVHWVIVNCQLDTLHQYIIATSCRQRRQLLHLHILQILPISFHES